MQYKIIKNFISKEEVSQFIKDIMCNQDLFQPCEQCPGSFKLKNFKPAVYLLSHKTKEVSDAVGEKLLPTYAFTRIYQKYSELVPHKDRDVCEITVTLHLRGDKPWDLVVEEDGEEKKISLEVGDAAIYEGANNKHWRDGPYIGKNYINVFLHYVRMNGYHSELYFRN